MDIPRHHRMQVIPMGGSAATSYTPVRSLSPRKGEACHCGLSIWYRARVLTMGPVMYLGPRLAYLPCPDKAG